MLQRTTWFYLICTVHTSHTSLCCGLQHPHTIISHISPNALPSTLKGQDFSGTRKNWNERSNLPFWIYFLHIRTPSSCNERQAGKRIVSNGWWSGRKDNQKHTTKVHKTKQNTQNEPVFPYKFYCSSCRIIGAAVWSHVSLHQNVLKGPIIK